MPAELDIRPCGANKKMRIGPDEALITDLVVYLLCKVDEPLERYQLSFPNPLAKEDGGLEWRLRYGGTETRDKLALLAAGEVGMLEHLVADHSMKEITDRLRRMRRAYKAIIEAKEQLCMEPQE